MKIILTSVGLEPEYTKEFLTFLEKDPKATVIAHIPTASDPEPDKSYVIRTVDEIMDLGIGVFDVDLKLENEETLTQKLSKADIILVGGGNTYYLLDWVRKSGFDRVIPKLLNEGKIYFGVSAGSLIACPEIALCNEKPGWDDNICKIKDFTGINLVDFVVSPHFEETDRNIIENYSKKSGLKVVPLTDKQAIIIKDGSVKQVGK